MRGQQDGRRKTFNSILAHGRPQDIVLRRERGKKMIHWLESGYVEMHGLHGKRHDYLVMYIDYSIPGEVRIFT